LWVITRDVVDETSIWVFEIWDDKESHDASLRDERAGSLIAEAMPLINGVPGGAELRVVGGHGINPK
jgi:quinol monooxygenase YgiN